MNKTRKIIYAFLLILFIGSVGFVGWATFRAQAATERAILVLSENNIQREKGLLVFPPKSPTNRGLIYYPGCSGDS